MAHAFYSLTVLNDVTHAELVLLLQRASKVCPNISRALKDDKLLLLDSGEVVASVTFFVKFYSDKKKFLFFLIRHWRSNQAGM